MTGAVSWGHRPDQAMFNAKQKALASKDGKGLTRLERAFWEAQQKNKSRSPGKGPSVEGTLAN